MANIEELGKDVEEQILKVEEKDCPYLSSYGIKYRFLQTDKQSSVIKVQKANELVKYFVEADEDVIVFIVYVEAFDKLGEKYQNLIIAHALASIEINRENGAISVINNGAGISEDIYVKYRDDAALAIFTARHVIKQIEEEKKENRKKKKIKE
jgi:hypothetical protein